MAKTFREGSMGAADAKNQKTALIVFSVLFGIIYLLFIIPNPWFFHYYFKNAGIVWKVIAFISIGVHYYFIWKKFRDMEGPIGGGSPAWVLFGWFALNIILLAGFNFSLPA